jgi:uncharacterized membrane protein YhaH (DUF805 family)
MPSAGLHQQAPSGGGSQMEWMFMPYRRYFDFSGRSRRKEYWMFILLFVIVYAVGFALIFSAGYSMNPAMDPAAPPPELGGAAVVGFALLGIFVLASIIPAIAVQVRRFHDQDRSGWFVLLNFIPYLGSLIVLVFMCLEGTRGPNRFGPDPKDPTGAQVFA